MTSKKSGTRKSRPPAKRNTQNRNESTSKPVRKSIPKLIRQDATRVEMFNSGLEVWIYDDKNAEKIRKKQLWQKLVDQKSTDGHLIGYSLRQDDSLCIDVVLGKPLTEKELAAARWLTPQQAFLRAPSGRIAIESNDSCRVSEEADDHTDQGALVELPAGNYQVTLYRVDHEALKRDAIAWQGAQEVLVFTPDGTAKHDVAGLLPFKQTADLEWSGRISVNGKTARGLVWFDDYWDTCFANLNHTAVEKLGLEFGNYLQISVPATGHKLVIAYARNWEEGARLKRPAGPKPSEFGFGAIVQPERWSPCEALFCRRVDTNLVVDDRHKAQWHEATFEVLDAQPAVPVKKAFTNALFVGAKRTYVPAVLAEKDYFEGDDLALCMKLDGRVDGVTFDERMSLAEAVAKLDKEMAKLKLNPLGDFSFDVETDDEPREFTVRPWTGRKEVFAVVCAGIDSFDVFFCSRFASGKWLVTCTLDEDDAERVTRARPQILMQAKEDVSLEALLSLHDEQLQRMRQEVETLPAGLSELVQLYDTYLSAALD